MYFFTLGKYLFTEYSLSNTRQRSSFTECLDPTLGEPNFTLLPPTPAPISPPFISKSTPSLIHSSPLTPPLVGYKHPGYSKTED